MANSGGTTASVMRWSLMFLAACYAPTPPEGAPCGEDDACPSGQFCSFGVCVEELAPCIEITAGPGALTIPTLRTDIVLDGQLDDWPTCFIDVTPETAGLVRDLGANGRYAAGRFSIAASPTTNRIIVAAEVTIVAPLGEALPPLTYENNAVSFYFDADNDRPTNNYGNDAAQIAIDHANRTASYRSGQGVVSAPEMHSATSVNDTTFIIEMSVAPESLNSTAWAPTVGFDIGLVGGNGESMTSELVWFQACTRPECGCTNPMHSAPYCDARQFGTATFASAATDQ